MDLVREFDRAGLDLRLPSAPIVATNAEIFQMDIQRHRGQEWFRMWRGHEHNEVRISDANRGRRQLVLLVQEEIRVFRERMDRQAVDQESLERAVARGEMRVVRVSGDDLVIERRTSRSLRRFLCGTDERHLFVAQF